MNTVGKYTEEELMEKQQRMVDLLTEVAIGWLFGGQEQEGKKEAA